MLFKRLCLIEMYFQITVIGIGLLLATIIATADGENATYLGTILKYYEETIHIDGQRRTPTQVVASIQPRPEGFENAKNWTTDSVIKLMYLIKDTEAATSLQNTMRKMFAPSTASGENYGVQGADVRAARDNVLQLRDHLNAQLPSAQISLDLVIDLLLPDRIADWLNRIASENNLEEYFEKVAGGLHRVGAGSQPDHSDISYGDGGALLPLATARPGCCNWTGFWEWVGLGDGRRD